MKIIKIKILYALFALVSFQRLRKRQNIENQATNDKPITGITNESYKKNPLERFLTLHNKTHINKKFPKQRRPI